MKFDMHVHTSYSERCGWMRPDRLIEHAIEKQLDGLAVTDHDTIDGAMEVFDIVKDQQFGLEIIIGEEIKTDRGEVLAYFIDEEIEPGPFFDVLSEIRRSGGISAIPHPFDRIRKGFSGVELVLGEVDAIEVLNSRCLFNRKALDLCQDHKKPMLGGSDAHFYREVGRAWTECAAGPRACILEGRTRVGGGLSNPGYLALTKGVKVWRKVISGSV
ncbi:MAG TPA: PHP domain-containing protein [Methanothrix sp.]|nr:PHP domain-containing protein [Methanothrix sp.]